MTPPSFHCLIDEYLTARRGLGFALDTPEGLLRDFAIRPPCLSRIVFTASTRRKGCCEISPAMQTGSGTADP